MHSIISFMAGLLLLVKGADYFIEAVAHIAKKLGVSEFIIGLTVTAIGTSIPELSSTLSAMQNGHPGFIIGNVIGSNIANIGLVVGFSAILHSFKTVRTMYDRDSYFLILSVILLFGFSYDLTISFLEALALLALYVGYVLFIIKTKEDDAENFKFHDFLEYMFDVKYMATIRSLIIRKALKKTPSQRTVSEKKTLNLFKEGIIKDIIVMALSGAAIFFGAEYMVDGAVWIARTLQLPESLIGLTLIALGTSLPELSVSISAARKGHGTIIVGNILGSNIANTLFIIGTSAAISPLVISLDTIRYTLPIMGFFSFGLAYVIKRNWHIGRAEGFVALASYVLFIIYAFVFNWT